MMWIYKGTTYVKGFKDDVPVYECSDCGARSLSIHANHTCFKCGSMAETEKEYNARIEEARTESIIDDIEGDEDD